MSIVQVQYKLTGITPLLMHSLNAMDLSNPLVAEMKSINAKRTKTTVNMDRLAELEFRLSPYLNDAGHVIVAGLWVEGTICEAARASNKGKYAVRAISVPHDHELEYDGPKNIDGLWESGKFIDQRPVVIQRNRIMRTRIKFNEWAVTPIIHIRDDVADVKTVTEWFTRAGTDCGIGDYRPKYGRFTVELLKNGK